jgi:hypothetical protein
MFLLDFLLTLDWPFLYPVHNEFTGTKLQQAIVSHSKQKPASRQQQQAKANDSQPTPATVSPQQAIARQCQVPS